jgi:putative transcriptional regulator
MIKIKIAEMLGKHKMSRKDLAEATGIRQNTIGLLYNEEIKRIDVEWLDKICKVFDCSLTDIIDYYPDDMIIEETNYKLEENKFKQTSIRRFTFKDKDLKNRLMNHNGDNKVD